MEVQIYFCSTYNSLAGKGVLSLVPVDIFSPLFPSHLCPRDPPWPRELRMSSLFALSVNGAFFLPFSREFVLQRERFRFWKVYAASLPFFFVFLVFIVMMTYGNYLHRSMLCCTEWERWSPGSIVLDALCKQPAAFAFPFFPLSFSPSLSPFSGIVWDTLHKRGRKLCHLRTAQFVYFVTPLVCELHKYLFHFLAGRGDDFAASNQHFDSFPISCS